MEVLVVILVAALIVIVVRMVTPPPADRQLSVPHKPTARRATLRVSFDDVGRPRSELAEAVPVSDKVEQFVTKHLKDQHERWTAATDADVAALIDQLRARNVFRREQAMYDLQGIGHRASAALPELWSVAMTKPKGQKIRALDAIMSISTDRAEMIRAREMYERMR